MGKRSTARKLAMQALFEAEISRSDVDSAFKELFGREEYLKETADFATRLARGAWNGRGSADETISRLSKNWSIERMGKVDLSVLRLAFYELNSEGDTPPSVVIDEAVELAKKFSTPDAAKFVNGILGAYLKEKQACSQGSSKK